MTVHRARVRETTDTAGTGAYALNGAVAGFRPFSAIGTSRVCHYLCTDGTDWEEGVGTTTSGTPWTLSRDRIISSSSNDWGGSPLDWAASSKDIFLTASSDLFSFLAPSTVSGGYPSNTATIGGMAIGRNAVVSADYGYAIGTQCTADGEASSARGYQAKSIRYGEDAWSSGYFSGANEYDATISQMVLRGSTTNATPTTLSPGSLASHKIDMPVETVTAFSIMLVGQERVPSGTGDTWVHELKGAIKRNSTGTTSLIGSVTDTSIAVDAGASGWAASVTADDANSAVKVEVTGAAATDINWVANCRLTNTTSAMIGGE